MSSVIDNLERAQLRRVPNFAPGDRVKVHFQVIEGERRRTQVFEGVVIARQGSGARETFTVRKQSFGVGVERTFPVHSPKIEKIDVAARGDVRRAKLYYLRDRVGKGARVRERDYYGPEDEIAPGLVHQPAVAAEAPEGDEPQTDADNSEQNGVDASVDQAEGSDQVDVAEVASDEAAQAESSDETAQPEADEQPEPEAEVADEQPEAEAADEQPEPEAEVADEQPEADSGEAAPAAEGDSEQPSDGSDEPSGDAA